MGRGAAGAHAAAPADGTAYSVRTQLPANLKNPQSYPAEAVCTCGQVIRCESVRAAGWSHTGRMAGEDKPLE
jgi:hypothetical protein